MIISDEAGEFMKEVREHDPNQSGVLDWNDEQYFADKTHVTNTHLKKINSGGPQHLKAYLEYGQEHKKAFDFGSAIHCLVLEPDSFDSRFFSVDDSEKCEEIGGARPRTTKVYKEWIEEILLENIGKVQMSMEEMDRLFAMRDKLASIPNVVNLLKNTLKEVVYTNTIGGVRVKCKTDAVNTGNYIVDLKSMSDPVTEITFRAAMRKFGYDQQGAFYKDVVGVKDFYFIAIEKTYPFTVGIFQLGEISYEEGVEKYENALKQYKYHFVEHRNEIDNHFIQGII